MAFSDKIVAGIREVADTLGGVAKLGLGTPGSSIMWPTTGKSRALRETGQEWAYDRLITILNAVAAGGVYAVVYTKASGVAAEFSSQSGFATVTKDEGLNRIVLTLDTAYHTANYVVLSFLDQVFSVQILAVGDATTFALSWRDAADNPININTQTARIVLVGPP